MNFFRHHNNGKLSQLKGEKHELVKKGNCRTKTDDKRLEKVNYEIGYRESKEKTYEEKAKAKAATKAAKNSNINNTSIHNEANGVKIENPSVFGKKPKSSKPTSKPGKAKKK